jgi:hypothetical protein
MMAKADGKNRPLLYGVWGVTSKRTLAICREAKIAKMRKSIYFSIACYRYCTCSCFHFLRWK